MRFSYIVQPSPDDLVQAFILGEAFIGDDDVCLVLGDNIFMDMDSPHFWKNHETMLKKKTRQLFLVIMLKTLRLMVLLSLIRMRMLSVLKKPTDPKSHYAVVGLYFYPNSVVKIAKEVKPSHRGELEITSINQAYLSQGDLKVELMGRGFAWLDTGTHESLLDAGQFIQTIEHRQSLKVACCLEEIAYEKGYITKEQLLALAEPLKKSIWAISYLQS